MQDSEDAYRQDSGVAGLLTGEDEYRRMPARLNTRMQARLNTRVSTRKQDTSWVPGMPRGRECRHLSLDGRDTNPPRPHAGPVRRRLPQVIHTDPPTYAQRSRELILRSPYIRTFGHLYDATGAHISYTKHRSLYIGTPPDRRSIALHGGRYTYAERRHRVYWHAPSVYTDTLPLCLPARSLCVYRHALFILARSVYTGKLCLYRHAPSVYTGTLKSSSEL